MKVLGLITEYNPFHNGHLYHLQESMSATGATHSVAVMSGNFLQRGEPALLHKWVRAKMAVMAGVDLVIELPTAYACATAELFAYGAVKILDALGIVDTLCFGSESGSLEELTAIASLLVNPPPGLVQLIQAYLKKGFSYPAARSQGLAVYLDSKNTPSDQLKKAIAHPNNILSIEYIKALTILNSKIIPATILRKKASYHSTEIEGEIISATAIREHLKGGNPLDALRNTVPDTTFQLLKESFAMGLGPVYSRHFDQMIISALRRSDPQELRKVFDVTEGLENRITRYALHHTTLESLCLSIKSKRYPLTRIQRIMIHQLLGIKAKDIQDFQRMGGPQYARILAFNNRGRQLIKAASDRSCIPIINKINQFIPPNGAADKMLRLDLRATDIYRLTIADTKLGSGPMDYTHSPHYIPI